MDEKAVQDAAANISFLERRFDGAVRADGKMRERNPDSDSPIRHTMVFTTKEAAAVRAALRILKTAQQEFINFNKEEVE